MLVKNHLEKSIFFLSHVLANIDAVRLFCLTSAAVLTFFFSPDQSRLFVMREVRALPFGTLQLLPLLQNMQYVCGAVNESCKTYSTSAVPLLVRNVQYVCGAVARNL